LNFRPPLSLRWCRLVPLWPLTGSWQRGTACDILPLLSSSNSMGSAMGSCPDSRSDLAHGRGRVSRARGNPAAKCGVQPSRLALTCPGIEAARASTLQRYSILVFSLVSTQECRATCAPAYSETIRGGSDPQAPIRNSSLHLLDYLSLLSPATWIVIFGFGKSQQNDLAPGTCRAKKKIVHKGASRRVSGIDRKRSDGSYAVRRRQA
jgi:hypothetical protein